MKNRLELKKEVKDNFRGHWGKVILIDIYPIIISLIFIGFIQLLLYGNLVVINPSGLIFTIFTQIISTGIMYTFIDWLNKGSSEIKSLNSGFQGFDPDYFGSVLVIIILKMIYTTLWGLLLIVPGIIKSYSYSQALNLYKKSKDEDEIENHSINRYFTQSRELMDGHKFDLFVLDLSFIGWFILCIFTCGIGYLWLIPYRKATLAAFYNDLIENYK